MDNVKETGTMSSERGYNEGYADGFSKGKEDGYEDGAEDLRTAILKVLCPLNYDLPFEFLKSVYLHNVDSFLSNNTAKGIIELVREEEKKYKEIKVGDEVIFSGKTGVVTNIEYTDLSNEPFFCVLYENGETRCKLESVLEKTGRHFPEIEKVLKALGGKDESGEGD